MAGTQATVWRYAQSLHLVISSKTWELDSGGSVISYQQLFEAPICCSQMTKLTGHTEKHDKTSKW